MKLGQQVCSLELSKKLKSLKVKQESLWYWSVPQNTKGYKTSIILGKLPRKTDRDFASAFTCSELGEMLPNYIENKGHQHFQIHKAVDDWSVIYWLYGETAWADTFKADHIAEDDTLANAMAKMLIHLIESNIIEFN